MNQEFIPIQTWIKALTSPNEEAYREIVNDPGATFGKAALWVTLAGIVGGFLQGVIRFILGPVESQPFSDFLESDIPFEPVTPTIGSIFSSTIFGGIGAIIGAFILIGLIYVAARALGGVGSFEKLFSGYAAFQVPISLVTYPLSAIPLVGFLGFFLGLYGLVLGVIANKVVMEYDWGKAIISSLAVPLVIGACIVVCLLTVLAGTVAALFSGAGY